MSWQTVTKLGEKLSEQGHLVTGLHTRGEAPVALWSWYGVGAGIFEKSDGDYVVTSDGKQWKAE